MKMSMMILIAFSALSVLSIKFDVASGSSAAFEISPSISCAKIASISDADATKLIKDGNKIIGLEDSKSK